MVGRDRCKKHGEEERRIEREGRKGKGKRDRSMNNRPMRLRG